MLADKTVNLAHRIAELPKEVPADAFYEDMRRMGEKRARLEAEIRALRQRAGNEPVATQAQYERFLERLGEQAREPSPESKRRIVQALVHRIEVTSSGFNLCYFAGTDQINEGEASASPSDSLKKKFFARSSLLLLHGAPGEINFSQSCEK